MTNKSLQDVREEIDKIDAELLKLLNQRMKASLKISKLKKDSGKEVFDPEREDKLIKRLLELNKSTVIPDDQLLEIWAKVLEVSREMQGQ